MEDCAQSHGNHWQGQTVGTFGDVGCFSFYPTKGCGAFGDAGCIVTNSDELAQKFRVYRNYGSEKRYHNQVVGTNSRLDELQAGLLRVKLTHLDDFNAERCAIAGTYNDKLKNPHVQLPKIRPGADCTWHQYVVHVPNGRDALAAYLKEKGIGTTAENLKAAAAGENYEWTDMYAKFAAEAKEEASPRLLSCSSRLV